MPIINLDYIDSESKILLSGDIVSLKNHRFAYRYLFDFFSPVDNESNIEIICNQEHLVETIDKIRSLLKKYGFEENRSITINEFLYDYLQEEKKFDEFSSKALNIRNNDCNPNDFQSFTESLLEFLPARRLYQLQLLSAYHLAFSQNACNFSVPGAGKTSIVYGAYTFLKHLPAEDKKKVDKILIIGPLSSFGPWETEYKECFGIPAQSTRLLSSLSRVERHNYLTSNRTTELTLVSYNSIPSLLEDIRKFLLRNKVMVVLDEAHKMKNTSGGVIAESILSIAKVCKARVVLTGTPAPNGYEDLYNLFKFIWPTKNVIKFPVNQLRFMSANFNDTRVNKLVDSISPFFIRIKKNDLGIPAPCINDPIIEPMGQIQQKIYNYIEKKYVSTMINSQPDFLNTFRKSLASAKVIRLMQAATDPSMLLKPLAEFIDEEDYLTTDIKSIDDQNIISEIQKFQELETPSKFLRTKILVQEIIDSGEKVIIWATFISTILNLKNYLEHNGIACEVLYGAIPVQATDEDPDEELDMITRERIIRQFHDINSTYKVIIANPFAVGESISLHKCCHNAIYLERSFNAGNYMQSKDRIHRYGLKPDDKTNYYFILSQNSIDETIHKRLIQKESRMLEIMEKDPIPLFLNISDELGDEDIRAIIKDYVRRSAMY